MTEITRNEAWGRRPYENHSRTVSEMKDRDPNGSTEVSRSNEAHLKGRVWDEATESQRPVSSHAWEKNTCAPNEGSGTLH